MYFFKYQPQLIGVSSYLLLYQVVKQPLQVFILHFASGHFKHTEVLQGSTRHLTFNVSSHVEFSNNRIYY